MTTREAAHADAQHDLQAGITLMAIGVDNPRRVEVIVDLLARIAAELDPNGGES